MTDPAPLPALPAREARGHKGTFGTVGIIGGCAHRAAADSTRAGLNMIGGPAFAALAALRAGAGLARLLMPEPILPHALTIAPSATGVALEVDRDGDIISHRAAESLDRLCAESKCIAIGPGLGVSDGARAIALRAVIQEICPVVVDADALNCLSEVPELRRDFHAMAVLTPHPREYKRIAAPLGINLDPANPASRAPAAEALAQRLGCIVVLKGDATAVSDGQRTWTHAEPNPLLATAGTGDVLTGLIAALIAQHHRSPIPAGSATILSEHRGGLSLFDLARLAVRIHANAAHAWRKRTKTTGGMLAADLIAEIPAAVEPHRSDA